MSDYTEFKTPEEVVTALSTLYFNLNELERTYYDMFINKTPMDVTLQRYNDLGVLETITLANRAKELRGSLTGVGSPIGVVEASVGTFYMDTDSPFTLYYKAIGTDSYGWIPLWSSQNLQKDIDFLSPTGSGAGLTDLDADSVTNGVLDVNQGGTGVASITGLVKGNGTGAFTPATPGVDYLAPYDTNASFRGMIAFFPSTSLPSGWLLCNGAAISRATYNLLFDILGSSYGAGDGSTTFNVPNLLGQFIKCWDSSTSFNTNYSARVGTHTHSYSGTVGYESGHTHTRGTMNITGAFNSEAQWGGVTGYALAAGAFYPVWSSRTHLGAFVGGSNHDLYFDASRSWTGSTSSGSAHTHSFSGSTNSDSGYYSETGEPQPKHQVLVPMIKY